ncbi:MAG: hypothetical protein AAGI01_07810, partial [Myxococcota bacterium]
MKHAGRGVLACLVAALALPGCDLVRKAASGGEISRTDVVNSADRELQKNEQKRERAAQVESEIREHLQEIEELRMNGRFSTAEYRVEQLNRSLEELRKVSPRSATLTSAPQQLSELESTYTEERYEKQVLGDECAKFVEDAKTARMEENWYYVNSSTSDYGKCRRKMLDTSIEVSVVEALDEKALAEYDAYASYLLAQAEEYRKKSDFYRAVGFESTLEDLLVYYKEIDADSSAPAKYAAAASKTRKKYRDPKEVEAEQQQKAFEAWKAQVVKSFDAEWSAIEKAEAAARPAYDEGVRALSDGEYSTALAKLSEARQQLYSAAYPSALALEAAFVNGSLEKGLSYEISAAIARAHFEQGNKTKLYPELSIIKNGRTWMSKDEELQVRMFDILADRDGKLTPKPTEAVRRYAGRYSEVGKQFKGVKEVASARRGEAYNMLGVDVETISHPQAGSNTDENTGKVVYVEDVLI